MGLPASSFPYKTDPFEFQREILRRSAARAYFAYHMDQGTGKSKINIDVVGFQYLRDWINGWLIVAPAGVHYNWADEEIPKHMTDSVGWRTFVWDSGKAGNRGYLTDFRKLLHFKNLPILCMNIEAITTPRGKAAAKAFLQARKAMFLVDESQDIASAGAARTKTIRSLARYSVARRTASGTAARNGNPMNLYPQMQFLSPDILKCGSSIAFKHTYAEWRRTNFGGRLKRDIEVIAKDGLGRPKYKNLEQLNQLIAPHSARVLKDDVLDLPPKVYGKRHFGLSNEQSRMYRELLEDWKTQFGTGEYVSVDLKVVQYLRLQQIICGYVPVDPGNILDEGDIPDLEPEKLIPGPNPRLELLLKTLDESTLKTIVWCRFRMDVKLIAERLHEAGIGYITYLGSDTKAHKRFAPREFQFGDKRVYIATGGRRGLTLTAAHTLIFYSNLFGLEPRLQAEDRAHRIGLTHSLNILDLIAHGTIDERIVRGFRDNKSVADILMGDPHKEWV